MRALLMGVVCLLIALPSFAATWSRDSIQPLQTAVIDVVGGVDAPGITSTNDLGIGAGTAGLVVGWQRDIDGTDAVATATVLVCPTRGVADAACETGLTLTSANIGQVLRAPGQYLRLRTDTAPTGGVTARVWVTASDSIGGTGTGTGGEAPGIVSNEFASLETVRWMGAQTTIPFEAAFENTYGAIYFSSEAGGFMPLGSDANDGLHPTRPKLTVGEARDVCFQSLYTVCYFDERDAWTVATQWGNGFGTLTDTQIATTTDTKREAIENPHFMIRPFGGGELLFDATGSTATVVCFSWEPTSYAAVLVENTKIICHTNTGTAKTGWEQQEAGIALGVGSSVEVSLDAGSGSGNLLGCHDDGVLHWYGAFDGSYQNGSTGSNPAVSATGGCSIVIATNGTIEGHQGTGNATIVNVSQSGGSSTVSVTEPLRMTIMGPKLTVPAATTNTSPVVKIQPDAAWTNEVEATFISVFMEHQETAGVETNEYFAGQSWDDAGVARIKGIYVTTSAGTPFSRFLHVPGGTYGATHTFDFQIAGCIIGIGTVANDQQILRIGDTSYDNGGTSIKFADCVYDSNTQPFRADAGAGFCTGTTPADFETNCDAQAPGAIDIDNNLDDVGTTTQYAGDGYCVGGLGCENQITPEDATMYNDDWHETEWCPAWMCGKTLKGFRGNPGIQDDDGRQAANTLHACVAGGPVPCGVM